jgi:hypothetical protein
MQIVVVFMVVYFVLLLLELLGKFLQRKLLALWLVFVVVGLGLAPVHLDPLLGLLDLQFQCSQECWDLSHQVSLDSVLWYLT